MYICVNGHIFERPEKVYDILEHFGNICRSPVYESCPVCGESFDEARECVFCGETADKEICDKCRLKYSAKEFIIRFIAERFTEDDTGLLADWIWSEWVNEYFLFIGKSEKKEEKRMNEIFEAITEKFFPDAGKMGRETEDEDAGAESGGEEKWKSG